MQRAELNYYLPPELIAQEPIEPRDAARLLVLHRESGRIEHRGFRDLREFLRPGDCLVLNDTRVLPARFFCRRQSGGRVEALFLEAREGRWRMLLKPSNRLVVGERIECPEGGLHLHLAERLERGEWAVEPEPPVAPFEFLTRVGHTPLPPYIRRDGHRGADRPEDAQRYQTVYAARLGAIAAPTAGLHFTQTLLDELRCAGVQRATVTLHVGVGTFSPVEVDELADHRMHAEWYEVSGDALRQLDATRRTGGRLVCVGTTSARVLETLARDLPPFGQLERFEARQDWTSLFIYPPFDFRNIDVMVTNFHLPGSTLLAMVMALAGAENVRSAYAAAIRERYRFFSYGDAMLIV